MIEKPIPESYWVIPGQFLAGQYPASTRGDEAYTRQRLTAFLNAGFDTYFNLTRPGELPSYLAALEEDAAAYSIKINYYAVAILDRGLPSVEQMAQTLNAIDAALDAGHKIYLHCWGGIGRTGTTVGCWLVRHGLKGEAALARLAELYATAEQSRVYPHSPETDEQYAFVLNWKTVGQN
ncbi:phosphatase [bacterium]|nr:phosphatase [bacterium]